MQCTTFNWGRVVHSSHFRLNLSQASNLSSCASEEDKQAPILYKLSKVNQALEALNITEIPRYKIQDQQYVEN